MVRYIDDYRDRFGVESICRVLPIAPSTYYEMTARARDPSRLPPRAIRDEQLKREGFRVARCTVARLMRETGLRGLT